MLRFLALITFELSQKMRERGSNIKEQKCFNILFISYSEIAWKGRIHRYDIQNCIFLAGSFSFCVIIIVKKPVNCVIFTVDWKQ